MRKKLKTLLELGRRESQSIVAASWKLGIFKDIPAVSRGCTKRIQFDGITITGVMSENNEISLNHRDPLRIHPSSAFHHASPLLRPTLGRERGNTSERARRQANQFRSRAIPLIIHEDKRSTAKRPVLPYEYVANTRRRMYLFSKSECEN